jgi:serine protease Do
MQKWVSSFLSLCLFVFSFTPAAYSATPPDGSIANMLQHVLPAVVNIKAQIKVTDFATLRELQKMRRKTQSENEPLPSTFTSVGSGVIVDAKNGFIITNAHVVTDAQYVVVTLGDAHHYIAKIIGADRPSDIALLQIKAKNLTALPLSNSNQLRVGDFVAAIGNPFGLSQTVTSGIVSALGRTNLGIENYENFIQTDTPINPGNSGGALVNTQGELVGINTAILTPERGSIGIGFAIPANMVKSVVDQLLKYGDVKRGVLGIGAQDITPDLATAFNLDSTQGAAITQVLPNSPAHQAGLQVGDIILSVNSIPVKNASDVVNTIGFLRVDTRADIELLRHHKKITATVTLSDAKKRKQMIEQMDPFLYGVGLKDFTLLSPIHGNIQGVIVVSVQEDSLAWNSDLRQADVITSVNETPVKTITELKAAVAKADKMLLLNVLRGPSAVFLVINKDQ